MRAEKNAVERLLKTARGQLDGILKMIAEDQYCLDISHQLSACEAVLRRANREVLRAHMEGCVRDALESGSPEERERKIEELAGVIERLSK